jgi:hypothetical protein
MYSILSSAILRYGLVAVVAGGVAVAVLSFRVAGSGQDPVSPDQLSPSEVADRFAPGKPWDGRGSGNAALEDLDEVTDFEVYWLGTEYAGYHLRAIDRLAYEPPAGAPSNQVGNKVIFGYGACAPTNPGCPEPLAIHVSDGCQVRPEDIASGVKDSLETIRGGATVVWFSDGHASMWTGRSRVSVYAPGQPAVVRKALDDLTPARGPRIEGLQSPDWASCNQVEAGK